MTIEIDISKGMDSFEMTKLINNLPITPEVKAEMKERLPDGK